MNATRNNWRPVIKDLLKRLQDAGFKIESVDDGDRDNEVHATNPLTARHQAAAWIDGVDEARLYLSHPGRPEGKQVWLFIVLGNDTWDLPSDGTDYKPLWDVCEAFSDAWEGKPVPKTSKPRV